MALFGMNFNFYYLVILRKVKDAVKMEEIRWYLIVFFFASITILFDLRYAGILGMAHRPWTHSSASPR